MNKKGAIALSQILILIIGIMAIGYAFGSSVESVKGEIIAENGKRNYKNDVLIELKAPQKPGITLTPIGELSIPKSQGLHFGVLDSPDITLPQDKIINGDKKDFLKGIWKGYGEGFAGNLAQGFVWAGLVAGGISLVKSMGIISEDTASALTKAAFGGILAERGITGLMEDNGISGKFFTSISKKLGTKLGMEISPGTFSTGIGIAVAGGIFLATYKKEETKTVTFTCNQWDAPTGGEYCEQCNSQSGDLPCSEYQCRSLGQSCDLLNKGTAEEKCVWVNRNDVNPPTIEPAEDVLLDDFKYSPDNTINPPDRGVKIKYKKSTNGCIKAFTPFTFGVTTNEPAKCKVDTKRKQNFSNMDYYFGGSSLSTYNHTQIMSLPGPNALKAENLTIKNDGEFELYVKCQDANGNSNKANFVFKYCVEKGPDTTPAEIVTTNLLNDMPIAYNQSSIDLELYTNEPADCKWSRSDQGYNDMEKDMSCSQSVFDMNAQMLYKCTTILDGLKDKVNNDFFFRCKDQPSLKGTNKENDRNVNVESYKFTLIGTQPLIINPDSIRPNETIRDSTTPVKVTLKAETSAGYDEGKATCYYTDTPENDGSYVMFLYDKGETGNTYKHSQNLYLPEGNYKYTIKCIDLGGNSDIAETEFSVESDNSPPQIVRIYKEESNLKIITDEKSECVYNTDSSSECNYLFNDGTAMQDLGDGLNHFTEWKSNQNYYVKCRDEYLNSPKPNKCSIIARPFNIQVA